MRLCIQNTSMPPKERDFENTVLSLRLTSLEAVRFWKVMDAAKARNPYVGKSDIYRELLGLNKPSALTDAEIIFFRETAQLSVEVAPKTEGGIPLINPEKLEEKKPDGNKKKVKNKRVS